ncbi:hypothetical protein D3C83_291170 [compost metagenome]
MGNAGRSKPGELSGVVDVFGDYWDGEHRREADRSSDGLLGGFRVQDLSRDFG